MGAVRAFVASALLLTALLAGCSADKDKDDGAATTDPPHDDLATPAPSPVLYLNVTIGNQTFRFSSDDLATRPAPSSATNGSVTISSSNTTSPGPTGNATGNATSGSNATAAPSGPAPLEVAFELGARRLTNTTGLRWTLGDAERSGNPGNASGNGTAQGNVTGNASASDPGAATGQNLPATVNRTYNTTGTYQVTYVLRAGNDVVDHLNVTIIVSGNGTGNVSAGRPLPDVLVFEYPESFGCVGDFATCVSREEGPGASGIDGFWQELDDRYWGLTFAVSGGANGDSDCQAFDADQTELGDFSNGGGECTGVLPDGAAYLFLYSYAAPSLGMTLEFTPPA